MLGLNPQQDEDFQKETILNNRTFDPSVVEPSFFEGSDKAAVMGVAQGVFGQPGQLLTDAIDPVFAKMGKPIDDIFGTDIEGFWKRDQEKGRQLVKALTPDPKTTGTGANILYSLSSVLPQAAIGGMVGGPAVAAALPGILQGYSEDVRLQQEGVDPLTAAKAGAITGITTAAGVVMPAALGAGLATKAATGAALNTAIGIPSRYATSKVLADNGYTEIARQFEPMDATAIIADIVLGAGFGAVAHAFPHEATDAAIVARGNYHAEIETAPGIPADTMSRNAHNAAVEAKMEELITGEQKDISQFIKPETNFVADAQKTADYEQLKLALEETGYKDILDFNDQTAAKLRDIGIMPDDGVKYSKGGFNSAVENAMAGIKQEKGSGDQFLAQIKNTAGVKEEEISWLGLDEFLKGKKSVTKQEVMDYIAQNKVQLEDVMLSDNSSLGPADNAMNELMGGSNAERTKFSQWQLAGGTNYREVAVVLPKRENGDNYRVPAAHSMNEKADVNRLAHVRLNDRVDADGKKVLFVEEIQSDWHQAGRKKGYKTELTAEQEKRADELNKQFREALDKRDAARKEDDAISEEVLTKKIADIRAELDTLQRKVDGVPDAPFKKTWHELAFKRILQEAVAKGYDRVAWTTGEQQADRYDMSRQVKKISVPMVNEGSRSVRIDALEGTSFNLMVDNKGVVDSSYSGAQFSGKTLDEVVGKELAEKIMSLKEPDEFSGDGLKVGGEGMKGFYDKIIPDYAKKLGKKYGAKVGETKVNAPEDGISELYDVVLPNGKVVKQTESLKQAEAAAKSFEGATVRKVDMGETVHSLDITPELRAAVEGGLPMFARGEGVAKASTVEDVTNAVRASFGDATDALMKAGKIKVVQSVKDLPGKHTGDVRGMTDAKGNVYIVAENVSPEMAKSIVLHEVGVHAGMEKMLGKRMFAGVLKDMDVLHASGNEAVRKAREAVPVDTKPEHVAEETLAYLVQNAPELPMVQRVIAAIRQWLYKVTGGKFVNLTEADLREMAVAALKREAKMAENNAGGGEKYSKTSDVNKDHVRLYRGLEKQFNPKHDLQLTDAPHGYSTWTDNPELARQYAGEKGFVYYVDLPKSELGKEIINQDGERPLFFDNEKKAGLNNISGKEYLLYTHHEKYDASQIKEYKNSDKTEKAPTSLEDQILSDKPDLRVVNDSGFQMFGRDAIEMADEKISEATKNGKLAEVAANCALRG